MKIKNFSTLKCREIKRRKRYFYVLKKQSRLTHRRTGNRGQTCLPVGLEVIGRVRVSQKPRPRLVQASISSLHHETYAYVSAMLDWNVLEVNVSPAARTENKTPLRKQFRFLPASCIFVVIAQFLILII